MFVPVERQRHRSWQYFLYQTSLLLRLDYEFLSSSSFLCMLLRRVLNPRHCL